MPALLKASMKTAVEAAELLRGGKKKTHTTSHAWHTGGGADPAGAPGVGSESGVLFLAASGEREEIRLGPTCPGGGIQAA